MTIKDVAERCGVSVSTVSRVLNNHPDVSEAIREKVMTVVRELHFVPSVFRFVRLGEHTTDLVAILHQTLQRSHGEIRRTHK